MSSQRITSLVGRSSDLFRFEDGIMVHGEFFTHLFYGLPSVKQFQVIQESKSCIEILIVPSKTLADVPTERIRNEIISWIGKNIEVNFTSTNIIEPTKTGKLRFTISRVTSED